MQEGIASKSAYRVALRRAAHQVFDDPVIFRDPLALRILGLHAERLGATDLRAPKRPYSRSLRAFVVARSRFAEDTLADAVQRDATQYVLLGAGLDTFGYRNPYPGLRVFEVDHPDTQQWKRSLLHRNGIPVPPSCTHVPVDLERQDLERELCAAGFDPAARTVFAWLGVVPYLSEEAFAATLAVLGRQSQGSALVLDYNIPRASLPHTGQLEFDSLAARVRASGEPFRLFFDPEAMAVRLLAAGYVTVLDLDSAAINRRYFTAKSTDRSDGLKVLGSAARLISVELGRNPLG